MNKIIINIAKKNKTLTDKFFSRFYHIWLVGIIIVIKKILNKTKINYKETAIYCIIAVLLSYVWQLSLTHYPNDKLAAWMFYSHNILFSKPLFGFVFEDLILFHPFGMLFGYLLFNKFKILENGKGYNSIKILFLALFSIISAFFAINIDFSSRISFLCFILPAIPLWYIYLDKINIKRFLVFLIIMIIFVCVWDFMCVAFPAHFFNETNRCWFYVLNGQHSVTFSDKNWMWLFWKQCPVSIDIIYPAGGMFFMTGMIAFIRDKLCKNTN